MSEFAPPISDQLLLDAIVQDPDCLETGLRLLETHRTPDKKACVASGFDRSGRAVVLYVKDIVRPGPDDIEWIPHWSRKTHKRN